MTGVCIHLIALNLNVQLFSNKLNIVYSCVCVCVQSVWHCNSMELSSDDAGLENRSMSGSWKHCGTETCTGENLTMACRIKPLWNQFV